MLGGFQIGRSALLTSQRAMQVTGQNLANAATIGYRRRTVELTSLGARNGVFSGQGVGVSSIRRELDPALAARLRGALSMEVANGTEYTYLSQVEALQDALGDNNLSTELTAFFGAFSNLADNPSDDALRGLAVSRGTALADRVNRLHTDYLNARTNLDADLSASAGQIDQLLTDIANLNGEIVQSQDGDVSALQDQRDLKLDELAQLVEIDVISQPAGSVTVQVNSIPVVLGNQSLGFEFERTDGGIELRTKDGTILNPTGGEIAALRRQDADTIQPAIDALEVADQSTWCSKSIVPTAQVKAPSVGKSRKDSVWATALFRWPTSACPSHQLRWVLTARSGSRNRRSRHPYDWH